MHGVVFAFHTTAFRIEFAGLVKCCIAHTKFANVMQQRGALQPAPAAVVKPSSAAMRSANSVTRSLWPLVKVLLELDDFSKTAGDVIKIVFIDKSHMMGRLNVIRMISFRSALFNNPKRTAVLKLCEMPLQFPDQTTFLNGF